MTAASTAAAARRRPAQLSSHLAMTHAAARTGTSAATRSAPLDAIVVPTARGAAALEGASHLATRLGVPLVALCSKHTRADEAAALLARRRGCRALVVDVPKDYRHDRLPKRTAGLRFRVASANRSSDLSLKRNLGLL